MAIDIQNEKLLFFFYLVLGWVAIDIQKNEEKGYYYFYCLMLLFMIMNSFAVAREAKLLPPLQHIRLKSLKI